MPVLACLQEISLKGIKQTIYVSTNSIIIFIFWQQTSFTALINGKMFMSCRKLLCPINKTRDGIVHIWPVFEHSDQRRGGLGGSGEVAGIVLLEVVKVDFS